MPLMTTGMYTSPSPAVNLLTLSLHFCTLRSTLHFHCPLLNHVLNDYWCVRHFGCCHSHCLVQTLAPVPSGKHTKSAQSEAGLVCSKYVGVNWTAGTPYVNYKEAIQPVTWQARAQEWYSASSTQCIFSCTAAWCKQQWHFVQTSDCLSCSLPPSLSSHALFTMHSKAACILNVCPNIYHHIVQVARGRQNITSTSCNRWKPTCASGVYIYSASWKYHSNVM